MSRIAAVREERRVVQNAADFGHVAVMLGGTSAEREVSLDTGAAVLAALQARGIDAHAWDPGEKPMAEFAAAGFDRVWIALHGTGGEDGALQGGRDRLHQARAQALHGGALVFHQHLVEYDSNDEPRVIESGVRVVNLEDPAQPKTTFVALPAVV